MLRTPVIRRSSQANTSNRMPSNSTKCGTKTVGAAGGASCLIDAEVAIDLPRRHVLDVVAPFLAFRREKVFEQVRAECVADEVVLLQLIKCLVEIARQFVDAKVAALAMAHRENVFVDRRSRVD